MAYTKNTWANGDVVTSAKLNNMEQGIYDASEGGRGVLLVTGTYHSEDDYWTIDKTVAEVAEAIESGMNVFLMLDGETEWMPISSWKHDEGDSAEVEFSHVGFFDNTTAVGLDYIHVYLEEGWEGGEDSVDVTFLSKDLSIEE